MANNEEMIKKLIKDYACLSYKNEFSCVKYYYDFNSVHVNVYFDCYDENCPSFNLILIYGKEYYFTPLNIKNNSLESKYLTKIPKLILEKILFEGSLEKFYNIMCDKILTTDKRNINYENDIIFTRTLHNPNNYEDKPFFKSLRKVPMSRDMFNKMQFNYELPHSVLLQVQKRGYTFVFTKNPKHRKHLTLILEEFLDDWF